MVKEEWILLEWEVIDVHVWWFYEVKPDGMDLIVKAKPAGKMKMNKIKILAWDWVQIELNEYDPTVGRILYRFKARPRNK